MAVSREPAMVHGVGYANVDIAPAACFNGDLKSVGNGFTGSSAQLAPETVGKQGKDVCDESSDVEIIWIKKVDED